MLKITKSEYNKLHNDFKHVLEMDFIWENKNYKGSRAMMKFIGGEGTCLIIEGIGFKIIEDDYFFEKFEGNKIENGIIQFTEEQAIKIYHSNEWKSFPSFELLKFQLFQEAICVDINDFKHAINVNLLLETTPWNMDTNKLIHRYLNQMNFSKPTNEELFSLLSEDLINKL